jgi:hypothetical protein
MDAMSTNRPSFAKRERDRAKKAKAAAKRDRRLAGRAEDGEDAEGTSDAGAPSPAVDESAILARLEELHRRYDDEQISFDDFEEQRAALLEQLAM